MEETETTPNRAPDIREEEFLDLGITATRGPNFVAVRRADGAECLISYGRISVRGVPDVPGGFILPSAEYQRVIEPIVADLPAGSDWPPETLAKVVEAAVRAFLDFWKEAGPRLERTIRALEDV